MLRIDSRALGGWLLAGSVVATSVAGACAEPKGAIMLAINTDMRAPKDVNAVSVSISTNGAIKHSFIGRVTPQGEVLLPATLAITEPDDKSVSIRIRVMAFQDRKPRVLRDVRTTIPSGGRTALLRIPLNFVNDASVVGAPLPAGVLPDPMPGTGGSSTGDGASSSGGLGGAAAEFDFFGSFQPPCDDIQNQTIVDGECKDNYVDSEALPDFSSDALGDSSNASSCFDASKCFAGAAPVAEAALDRVTCTLQLNGADPARLNLAIATPDTGECVRPGECYVPIDRGSAGWTDVGGRVQLPRFVCPLLDKKKLGLVTSPNTCAAKLDSNPICTANPGDAMPNADGGSDGGVTTEKANCPPGEYVSGVGAAGGTRLCTTCPPSSFSALENRPACDPWTDCSPGTYVSRPGSSTTDRGCAACAAGQTSATKNAATCAVTPVQVVAGASHTCARFSDGSARCWGANSAGQLGDGTTTDRLKPTVVPGLTGVSVIGAGYNSTCAGLDDGSVRCWGANAYGQVGDGTTTNRLAPTLVVGVANAMQLSGGHQHTCARLSDGSVRCWGHNGDGRLGNGTLTASLTPTVVTNLSGATDLAVGLQHNCARIGDGTVRCWGSQSGGELGDGASPSQTSIPVNVSNLAGATEISVGANHSCARMSDGSVQCWGSNQYGQIADGTTTNRLVPVAVPALTGVTDLESGNSHTCARLMDGSLRCWGQNVYGQLGDGTNIQKLTPTAVPSLTGVNGLSRGAGHVCALISDGSVRCWGNNLQGQLGDGTTTQRLSPTLVNW